MIEKNVGGKRTVSYTVQLYIYLLFFIAFVNLKVSKSQVQADMQS
jgi:hypothetical protein